MIPIPGYSSKLAEIVEFRFHRTITHYRGVYAVSIMTGSSRYHILYHPLVGHHRCPRQSPASAQEANLHAAIDGEKARRKPAMFANSHMGTERCINVVSCVKYGRDVGDVIHNVVSASIIRRRNITEYSTSSKRRDLERIRRHCRQSNATSIDWQSKRRCRVGLSVMRFINKCMKTKGNKSKCIKYCNK